MDKQKEAKILDEFILTTNMIPKADQIKAIDQLTKNLKRNINHQVLLGATGTGKTFTIANVIKNVNKKTLVIVHNKTLAAQLYAEFKELFKENKVEYFVSYFDYYQPEAYLPSTDTYVEKSSKINLEIEMLRLSTLQSLATEKKVIVIASVAAIYPSVNPAVFNNNRIILNVNAIYDIKQLQYHLVKLQFKRNDTTLLPGTFKVHGDVFEIMEGNSDQHKIRISFFGNKIEQIAKIDNHNNTITELWKTYIIYPANEYIADNSGFEESINRIKLELKQRIEYFTKQKKLVEKQRIKDRTSRDIETLIESGFCSGIENYARHLELREKDSTPYTIFDYLGDDWLLVIDESHMTIPQIKGMYFGDRSRKLALVDYGFRLPSALDNRPLNFHEFTSKIKKAIYVSATPADYEKRLSNNNIVEQVVRPTGLLDPIIYIKPTHKQIDQLITIINQQVKLKQRTLVLVLTIKMAENLTKFLREKNYKVAYLHNQLKTLERVKIINALRKGIYDVIVGINLLREGLDVPEVSCAVIFDADKPGIFRSFDALIQIFGRTARNENAHVYLFADSITSQMKLAIDETNRRRALQIAYNKKNNIIPKTIVKPIIDDSLSRTDAKALETLMFKKISPDKNNTKAINKLKKLMLQAAKKHEYEQAAYFRDLLFEIEQKIQQK